MNKYFVTKKSQLKNGWPIFVFLAGAICLSWIAGVTSGSSGTVFLAQYSAIGFLLVLVPHLAIHLRYLRVSRGWTIIFDRDAREIRIEFGEAKLTVSEDDISKIEMYLPKPVARNTVQWFPWQGYCYAIVRFGSGHHFVITSLQVPMLRWEFDALNLEVNESMYCWPRESNNLSGLGLS